MLIGNNYAMGGGNEIDRQNEVIIFYILAAILPVWRSLIVIRVKFFKKIFISL